MFDHAQEREIIGNRLEVNQAKNMEQGELRLYQPKLVLVLFDPRIKLNGTWILFVSLHTRLTIVMLDVTKATIYLACIPKANKLRNIGLN